MDTQTSQEFCQDKPSFKALIPFLIFIVIYVALGLICHDIYKVPIIAAFLPASASAFLLSPKKSLNEKMEAYAKGMGETNIMIMCLIFVLAGAFASLAAGMNAVQSAVLICRHLIPARAILAGFFLLACFLSMAIGTSCGTIACMIPIAMGLVNAMGIQPELMIGVIVGGAMFGDNLSMISDTTIAATRTQGVEMRDKFLTNIKFILPAAGLCLLIYLFCGKGANLQAETLPALKAADFLRVLPYIAIIILALLGVNVAAVLFFGIVFSQIIGLCTGAINFWGCMGCIGKGALAMSETMIIALLSGGLLCLIRQNGGIAYVLNAIRKATKTSRGCEFGVFLLTCMINLFTANNTVAIVIAGPLAKELSDHYGCTGKRIAAILDTASCFIQGIIPYGAQILSAIALTKLAGITVNPVGVLCRLYYPLLMGISTIVFIFMHKSTKKIV